MTFFYKFWKRARVYYTLSISRGGGAQDPPGFATAVLDPNPGIATYYVHRLRMYMGARRGGGGQEGALAPPLEIHRYGGPPKDNLTRNF